MRGRKDPSAPTGVLVAVALVAATTAMLYPLREIAPPVSLGVVYVLVVLVVSTFWTPWLAVATAVTCALAFNFFHLPPTGRLAIASTEHWVALLAFFVVALAAGAVAQRARLRARDAELRRAEADLAAEVARLLLGENRLADGLTVAGERIAVALDLTSAAVVAGAPPSDSRREAFALGDAGWLVVPAALPEALRARLRTRVAPALSPTLAAALERAALQNEVVETASLRQSDVAKTAVLRAVSHDLRSPLTAMVTAGEALRSSALLPGEREELAAIVVAEGSRLSRLIEKLLDLSRLQARTEAPRRGSIDLEEVLRVAAEGAGGEVCFSIGPLPPLSGDAAQLERAFANLLENAVRFSGGEPVSVRARALHDRVVVRVVDRGPGIPRAEQQRIFEPFHRGTRTDGHAGAGLGLAIVRGLVEANRGRVSVESLPGQGSSFVVELPLEPAVAAATR